MIRSKVLSGLGMGVLALALAACGSSSDNSGGGGSSSAPADNTPAAATVNVVADPTNVGKFDPATTTVKVGDTVKWTFSDDASPHTVTSDDSSTFDSMQKAKGDTFTHKFDKAGTFAYHCTLHANMKAQVTVS